MTYPACIDTAIESLKDMFFSTKTSTSLTLLAILSVLATCHILVKWIHQLRYFPKLNITGPTPKPLVGTFIGMLSKGIAIHDEEMIRKYGKIVGCHEAGTPVILCTDLDMIKHVMIKDFHHFPNRRIFDGVTIDPMDKFLLLLKDEEWKNVRSIVSTTFTSGKMKGMFDIMKPYTDNFVQYLSNLGEVGKEFEAKECCLKLTFDVMSSCCFGIQTDCLTDPNDVTMMHLKKLQDQKITVKFLFALLFPKIMQTLAKYKIVENILSEHFDYFRHITEITLERRRKKEQYRNDFIQIMVDHEESVKTGSGSHTDTFDSKTTNEDSDDSKIKWKHLKKTLTNTEILAQAILFLLVGSDTTATLMSYIAYELAMNPDIQDKLYKAIKEKYDEYGDVTYEMITSIEYLDMVIDETLRLFPPGTRADRECVLDYNYKNMKIPKGCIWGVCIWALHRDPSIYPDPEKFDPERFSPENKKTRDSCAFIPFGAGPRNCVGLRFGLQSTKMMICKVLLELEFITCEKTPRKITIDNTGTPKSKEPIMLKVLKRK